MSTAKVRMTRAVADGAGASWQRGRDYDVDVDLAQAWVAAGIAEPVDEPDPLARLLDALHAVDVDALDDDQRDGLTVVLRDRLRDLAGDVDDETPNGDDTPPPVDPAGGPQEGDPEVPDQPQEQPEPQRREPVKATRTPARKAVKPSPAEPAGPADK